MSQLHSIKILALGAKLAAVAQPAFPAASFEVFKGQTGAELDQAATRADLVLIEGDGQHVEAVTSAIQRLARLSPQPAVILTGAGIPIALVRAMLKLQRSDILEAPLNPDELARAAAPLMRTAEPAACVCWGVMGAVGGAGATTVSVEIGATLAACDNGKRGCLIDLNLADGAAAAYLGVTPNMRLDGADLERIDAAILDAYCTPVSEGFDLLASPRSPRAFDFATPQAVMRVLEVAAQTYDWLVIDLPRRRNSWTLDIISGCDEILVVSELTVPALVAARELLREIEEELPDRRTPQVILNRMSGRLLGPAPTLREAQKALSREALATITSDWESAAKSVNLGGPILYRQPRSRIVKDVADLIAKLEGANAVEAAGGLRLRA